MNINPKKIVLLCFFTERSFKQTDQSRSHGFLLSKTERVKSFEPSHFHVFGSMGQLSTNMLLFLSKRHGTNYSIQQWNNATNLNDLTMETDKQRYQMNQLYQTMTKTVTMTSTYTDHDFKRPQEHQHTANKHINIKISFLGS